jgi:hypothetical protein
MSEKTRCCDDRLSPPVAPVEPVVSNSCAFYTAHEAAGAASIRSSLRPCIARDNADEKLGHFMPREHGGLSCVIIASEAKQSIVPQAELWNASSRSLSSGRASRGPDGSSQ